MTDWNKSNKSQINALQLKFWFLTPLINKKNNFCKNETPAMMYSYTEQKLNLHVCYLFRSQNGFCRTQCSIHSNAEPGIIKEIKTTICTSTYFSGLFICQQQNTLKKELWNNRENAARKPKKKPRALSDFYDWHGQIWTRDPVPQRAHLTVRFPYSRE